MASPTPKRNNDLFRPLDLPAAGTGRDVSPRWIISALLAAVLVGVILAYLCVCLLIYQGGWQRILFPSATIDKTPASVSLAFESVRFDAAATGQPRLTGWFLPSDSTLAPTVLFLHDGGGNLSNTLSVLALLHQSGVNIFAIDYRGYGQSAGPHPTEVRMQQDAAAALDYLVNTRHIAANRIITYGLGLGAVVATNLANTHAELPGVIVDQPHPQALQQVVDEDRSRLLPMRLLVQEHFDIAGALANLHKPKLLLVDSPSGWQRDALLANQALFRNVPDPKITVTFQHPGSDTVYLAAIRRFLDEVAAHP